jgi:hypothetical protein
VCPSLLWQSTQIQSVSVIEEM